MDIFFKNPHRLALSLPCRIRTVALRSTSSSTLLGDEVLRADWLTELEEIRTGMLALRETLAAELRRLTNSDRFDFLLSHKGMFSRLGASPEQVERMRAEHGIYMVGTAGSTWRD